MSIVFESNDTLLLSEKELVKIKKKLMKKSFIFLKVMTAFLIIMFVLGIVMLFYDWNMLFYICGAYLLLIVCLYKNIPIKFRDTLLKMPNYRFEDENFYVGEKQFAYSDIEMFEIAEDFARIKMGKYKLVLIFKNRDKSEIDMLIEKLKASAKRCKAV